MPKISTSLAIAFVIHIFFLALSAFVIEKPPSLFLLTNSKAIHLNFGSSVVGTTAKSIPVPSQARSTNSSTLSHASNLLINHGDASLQDMGFENLNSSGLGDGDIDNFENLAVSYKGPIYPRLAIKRELQGSVSLRIKVSAEGVPSSTEILKSSGHAILDKAALEAVTDWRFQPKKKSYFVEKTIIFQLKN